jgi:pimeloyl-ACP methyl ester carboxylesterase
MNSNTLAPHACTGLARHLRQPRSLQRRGALAALLLAITWLAAWAPPMAKAADRNTAGPTVVLVHGAWADGSTWSDVVSRLQARGLRVVSVQNQLNSLADDVAAVNRALEREAAPVVLVAHSWGGTVATQAGASDKVAALVYIAAFAPDLGQSTNDVQAGYPPPGYAGLLQADSGGYLWFAQADLPHWFAQDLPTPNAMVLAAAQNPIHATAFADKVTAVAWRSKPTWYLVTEQDRMIYPSLQREMAAGMNAQTRSVAASHVPFISRPRETTAIILDAVASVRAP